MQPNARWRPTAVALALLAASLPIAARVLVGPRGATVYVRWQPSVTESVRQNLEARFRLADGERLDESTWRYDLIDPSSENIRALVIDPAVADTHDIDRPNNAVEPSAGRTGRRQRFAAGGESAVWAFDRLALTLAALAGLLTLVGASGRMPAPGAAQLRLRRMFRQLSSVTPRLAATAARFAQRGVPEIHAETAGLFRIVFGSAVLAFFASHPVDASWLADTFDLEIEGRPPAAVIEWLRGHPTLVDRLTPWLLLTGVAFTVGILTRLTYPLFVAGVLVWAYVAMSISTTSIHPSGPFVLTLVALLPSRWGDALSLDAWLHRTGSRESAARPPSRQYGYSVWVPGLVLGVAFAAAAWAKLSVPPGWTDWILNGTVKYHFVRDSVNAPVGWGLQFANRPLLAILASFGVVAIEAAVVTAAFTRNESYRLALGTAALALLSGFYVFMGVFWPAWWILPLGFLPWRWLSRRLKPARTASPPDATGRGAGAVAPAGLRAAQLAIIVFVIAQQLISSARKVELVPMFSWYGMYSGTYASPGEWNASREPLYRLVVSTDRGRAELPACDPYPAFVREFETALEGSAEARTSIWRALRACGEDLTDARDVALEGDVHVFDWDRLTFTSTFTPVVLGPLAAEERAIAPAAP